MAVSTTSTVDDITQTVAIEPVFAGYAADFTGISAMCHEYDLRGRGSATIQVPSLASSMGTIDDAGSGVDTEFDATEGTDLTTTTTQSTNSVTCASSEYAVYMAVTDDIGEDSVPQAFGNLMDEIFMHAAEILLTAFESDVWALLSSLNGGTAVGSPGSDLTLANLNSGIVTLRNNGIRAPDGLVGFLAPIQGTDFEDAILATGSNTAVYDTTADRFMGVSRDGTNGLASGFIGSYRSTPLFISGLAARANTNEDRVGALFVPWTARNARFSALMKTISRPFRLETDRDITLRGEEIVASMRMGAAERQDAAGVPVITDA